MDKSTISLRVRVAWWAPLAAAFVVIGDALLGLAVKVEEV